MIRRSRVTAGLLLTCATAGCVTPCWFSERDYQCYQQQMRLPANRGQFEADSPPQVTPVPEPATVLDPERAPCYLSLAEAIAIALEHGTVGVQSNRLQGLANDDLVQFTGQGVAGSDSIRVLALNPASAGASIEAALARFDVLWTTSMSWTTTDEPNQGLTSFQNGQAAAFSTALAKPLPTGGVAGVTFSSDYRFLTNPPGGAFSVLNPSYTPRLVFGFEQPLWRDFGLAANQLLSSPPPSTLFPNLNSRRASGATDGIVIARVRFDQARAEFERTVHFLLLNVETAYWNLYGSYVNLYSVEQALHQAYQTWRISKDKYEEGKIDIADFAPTRGQYEQFRGDRFQVLEQVLDNERILRTLLGLPVEDGRRLLPVDTPTLAPYHPDWKLALDQALTLRPELVLARQDVKARQLNLLTQKNALHPDLRLTATYSSVGLGSRLDGNGNFLDATGTPRTTNALRSLISNHYNDWTAGLTLNVPLGFRQEHAVLRQAELQLAQSCLVLREQETKAQTVLARQYGQVLKSWKLVETRRAQRLAYAEQVRARFHKFVAGHITVDFLLDAQRQWANALSSEYQAIVDYNNALARFEFARGTILRHDNVVIAEGPLSGCATVRAVEHERQRTRALVLRQRAQPIPHPGCSAARKDCGLPRLPPHEAPALPALLAGSTPAPEKLEEVPAPQVSARRSEAGPAAPSVRQPRDTTSNVVILTPESPPADQ